MDAITKWKPTLNKLQEQFQKKKDVEGKRKFTSGTIGLYLLFIRLIIVSLSFIECRLDDFDAKSFGVSDDVPKVLTIY